ncbi:MAG: phosphate acetyltransferase, partial [Oscillospiraceae bacterium]|nr:phosphate acetyltransferase [Oscillospiraceae bacterium]
MGKFIDSVKAKAKSDLKTIVLAEGEDLRTIKAAALVKAEGYAKNVLLGDPEKIKKMAAEENLDIDGIE